MAGKFDKAHLDLRLYVPLESGAWEEFRKSATYQALIKDGLVLVHSRSKSKRKGGAVSESA